MEEICNLLMKKTKDELADIIDILFSDKDFVITTTTPKRAIVNFIASEYVDGLVLPNLFSALSSTDFNELTTLICNSPVEFILEPGYQKCELFYKLGLVRKKYNYYYPTQVLLEKLDLFNTERETYFNKEINWIASCFHYANAFFGVYPLEAVFIMANNCEQHMDKATFLTVAKQISEYALDAVAISVDSYYPLKTLLKANELKAGQEDFLFSAQANCDFNIPEKQTVELYDRLGYIPNDSLDSLYEFVNNEKNDEDFATLFVYTVFETNRFSLNFEQYRANLDMLLSLIEFSDTQRLEQLIHEIYFTCPAMRCKGGIPEVNDIVGLMLDGISLTLKQALNDLDNEKAMEFVKETFIDIDRKFHQYFGDEVKDIDLFENLPLS